VLAPVPQWSGPHNLTVGNGFFHPPARKVVWASFTLAPTTVHLKVGSRETSGESPGQGPASFSTWVQLRVVDSHFDAHNSAGRHCDTKHGS
jgi:hypothetical protein